MAAPTVPQGADLQDCPEPLPTAQESAAEAVEALVRRRLAAVDAKNATCLDGLFAASFAAASVFTPTEVAVGVEPGGPDRRTATRDQPGTELVGPVTLDPALAEMFCGDLQPVAMSDADYAEVCTVATYPMALADGRTFTEFAHVARGSLVFDGGRFAYDGVGPWAIAVYGFATAPA